MSTCKRRHPGCERSLVGGASPGRGRCQRSDDCRTGPCTVRAKTTQSKTGCPARKPAPKGPGLGVPATPAQIDAADVSIGPDGAGLPPGSGTPAQGEAIYTTKCIACHGPQGAGTVNDRLVGGQGTLASPAPVKTIGSYWPYATTVFDYVRRAMPYPDAALARPIRRSTR